MRLAGILSNDPHNVVWDTVYNKAWSRSSKAVILKVEGSLFFDLNRFYDRNFSLRIAVSRSEDA